MLSQSLAKGGVLGAPVDASLLASRSSVAAVAAERRYSVAFLDSEHLTWSLLEVNASFDCDVVDDVCRVLSQCCVKVAIIWIHSLRKRGISHRFYVCEADGSMLTARRKSLITRTTRQSLRDDRCAVTGAP